MMPQTEAAIARLNATCEEQMRVVGEGLDKFEKAAEELALTMDRIYNNT